MRILLCAVGVLFGGLSLIAAISQMKSEKRPISAMVMAAGSLVLLAAVPCNIGGSRADGLAALLGSAAICGAAIRNGIKSGQLHLKHHIIRISLSLVLTAGFILW